MSRPMKPTREQTCTSEVEGTNLDKAKSGLGLRGRPAWQQCKSELTILIVALGCWFPCSAWECYHGRIIVSDNGSFRLNRYMPIYIQGSKPGTLRFRAPDSTVPTHDADGELSSTVSERNSSLMLSRYIRDHYTTILSDAGTKWGREWHLSAVPAPLIEVSGQPSIDTCRHACPECMSGFYIRT